MDHVKVDDAGKKGLGLFAKHSLSTKQTIHTIDEPALIAISSTELPNFCYTCYAGSKSPDIGYSCIGQRRDAKLQICTGCRTAWFCGKACQTIAWKQFHKHECTIFASIRRKGILPEPARALLRFILQHDKHLLPEGLWNKVLTFESHIDQLRSDGSTWTNIMFMAKACHQYSGTNIAYDIVLKLLCILKINGMVLTTTFGDEFGVYLDPILLIMNHSCDGGNVFIHRPIYTNYTGWSRNKSSKQSLMKLLPMRDIAEDEELTITYIDHTDSLERRQKSLQNQYKFTCDCTRCGIEQYQMQNISRTNNVLFVARQNWSQTVEEALNMAKSPHVSPSSIITTLSDVVEEMEQHPAFSAAWYPYPCAVHELKLLHMADGMAFDKALICAAKQFFVIGPAVYMSPLHPHRIVHAIFLLQILALFADTYAPDQSSSPDLVEQRRRIENKGFDQASLLYWRLRICVVVRTALSRGAVDDLVEVFTMALIEIGFDDQTKTQKLLKDQSLKSKSMKAMQGLIVLDEDALEAALESWII